VSSANFNGDTIRLANRGTPKWTVVSRREWVDYTWDGSALRTATRTISAALGDAAAAAQYQRIVYAIGDRLYLAEVRAGEEPRPSVACWGPFAGEKKWEYSIPEDPTFVPAHRETVNGTLFLRECLPIRLIATPDAKKLFVVTRSRVILLDGTTGKELKVVPSGSTKANKVEIDNAELSDDGALLVLGVVHEEPQKNELRLYGMDDLDRVTRSIPLSNSPSRHFPGPNIYFDFSRDSKLLAVGESSIGIRVFDVASGTLKYDLPQALAHHSLSLSADGTRLVARDRYTALVWDLNAFKVK